MEGKTESDIDPRCENVEDCRKLAPTEQERSSSNSSNANTEEYKKLTKIGQDSEGSGDDSPDEDVEDYLKLKKIGQGTYGEVFKAKHKITGRTVAIKKVLFFHQDFGVPPEAIRECAILRQLTHPNIVALIDVFHGINFRYLVFEYLPTDLKKFIGSLEEDAFLDLATVKSYMYQILQATCYCHQRAIIHRDLKPQNFLLDGRGAIKMADFGLARTVERPVKPYTHQVATLWYRAPEILLGSARYSMGVDIWSIACIFAEMFTKKPLFPGDSEIGQLFKIFSILTTPNEFIWEGVILLPNYEPSFPRWETNLLKEILKNYIDSGGIEIIQSMLNYDPERRTSAKVLLRNAYFKDVDRSQLPADIWDGKLEIKSEN